MISDGVVKGYTKDCGENCEFYRAIPYGNKFVEVCGANPVFKFLRKGEYLIPCIILRRKDKPENPCVTRIDESPEDVISKWIEINSKLKSLEAIANDGERTSNQLGRKIQA